MTRYFLGNHKFGIEIGLALGLLISSWGVPIEAQQISIPPEVLAYPNIIVYNGKVLTVDDNFDTAEAFAVRDGKFLAVGTDERIRAMAGPETRLVDLKGRSAVPGFIDTHNHYNGYAERGLIPRVIFRTRDQWLREIKRLVDVAQPGEWIILRSERSVDQPWAAIFFWHDTT